MVLKWSDPVHQARIGRMFEHERMKKVSADTIQSVLANEVPKRLDSHESARRAELLRVAQGFIVLQQARHDADYNLARPLDPADAATLVDRANSCFAAWEVAQDSEAAREYLFLLLFKEKDRR
jgi:hypothetical protein